MSQTIGFHEFFPTDLSEILTYYERESGPNLANEFYEEFQARMKILRTNPAFFPHYCGNIRRVNLKRFPYHFLYEIHNTSVWIFVIRHNKRNPRYGMERL